MTGFLIYMIKTAVCLIIFHLIYKAFLSNDTFFRFNRWILLIGTTVCFVLPSIRITIPEKTCIQTPISVLVSVLQETFTQQPETRIQDTQNSTDKTNTKAHVSENNCELSETDEAGTIGKTNATGTTNAVSATGATLTTDALHKQAPTIPIHFSTLITALFFIGFFINLCLLIRSFRSMFRFFKHAKKINHQGCKVIITNHNIVPFSAFGHIVLSIDDFEHHRDLIIPHEAAHLQHNHSFDILYFEVFILLQWFNPAIRLLKKELKDIHEYQADAHVLQSGIDATRYQLLLVKKAVGASSYTLANSFNHSKIKKRITMMLKEKSTNRAKWKLSIMLPALGLMLGTFATPVSSENNPISPNKKLVNPNNHSLNWENAPTATAFVTADEVSKKSDEPEKYSKEYFKKEFDTLVHTVGGGKHLPEGEISDSMKEKVNIYTVVANYELPIEKKESIFRRPIEKILTSNSFRESPKPLLLKYTFNFVGSPDATKDATIKSEPIDEDYIWKIIQTVFEENEKSLEQKVIMLVKFTKSDLPEIRKNGGILQVDIFEDKDGL